MSMALTDNCKVAKRLSDTRWSAHGHATSALHVGYDKFQTTLLQFSEDYVCSYAGILHEVKVCTTHWDCWRHEPCVKCGIIFFSDSMPGTKSLQAAHIQLESAEKPS